MVGDNVETRWRDRTIADWARWRAPRRRGRGGEHHGGVGALEHARGGECHGGVVALELVRLCGRDGGAVNGDERRRAHE